MDEQTVRILLRLTARISCAFFLVGFAGRAAARVSPTRIMSWLAAIRGEAFLALAWSHTLHLVWIIAGLVVTHGALVHYGWLTFIFGGLGFACVYTLAMIYNARPAPWNARPLFEAFAGYYVWLIFFAAMAGQARRSIGHAFAAVLLLIAFVANLYAGISRRRAQPLLVALAGAPRSRSQAG